MPDDQAALRLLHETYAVLDIRNLLDCFPESGEVWPHTAPLTDLRDKIGEFLYPAEES
jgi:hypothetical protein